MSTTLDRSLLAASWRSWYANDLRIVGPRWLQLVWTFLFSCAIGVAFFVLGLAFSIMGSGRWPSGAGLLRWFLSNIVVALTVGFVIHGLFTLTTRLIGADRIRRFSNAQRGWYFGGVPFAGLLIGWPLGAWLIGAPGWFPFTRPYWVIGSLMISVLLCVLFYFHFDAKARQIEAEKRASEAQLRLLQGQMEPHFLFNTLANVLTLIDSDTARAKSMLESFTDYLRSSLGSLRRSDSTLGQELELAQAYLRLLQLRMDDRLRFRVEADADVRRATLPPLLLQPLIENAIVHGLEPKIEGGEICIVARVEGNSLVLTVADDGLGPEVQARHRPGNGVAVENIRQRLAAHFGAAGSLTLEGRQPGTLATLRLPFERSTA